MNPKLVISKAEATAGAYAPRRRPLRNLIETEQLQQELDEHEEERKRLENLRSQVRSEWKTKGRTSTLEELEWEAQKRWIRFKRPEHPHAAKFLNKTRPTTVAVPRLDVVTVVELRAMRLTPQGRAIERGLLGQPVLGRRWSERVGRGPVDGKAALATLEIQAWEAGKVSVHSTWNGLNRANLGIHWSCDAPMDGGAVGTYNGVLNGLHSMCRMVDPELFIAVNLDGIRQLREIVGDPEIGKYCAIDGTFIPAPREQRATKSKREEELVNHGRKRIGLGFHGKEGGKVARFCNGSTEVTIGCMKSNLALVWVSYPSNEREFLGVRELLDLLFKYWPDCPIEYLSGDSEYDQSGDLSLDLERKYCIHPSFTMRGTPGEEHDWHKTNGTPSCPRHDLMKLVQSDGFPKAGPESRRQLWTAAAGSVYDMSGASHRWFCPACTGHDRPEKGDPVVTTRFQKNPRLYPWLPHDGDHWRVGLREALSHRRNTAESINACMKAYGAGGKGKQTSYWLSEDGDFDTLMGMVLVGQTIRRLAHMTGLYENQRVEADAIGVLTPETLADIDKKRRAAGIVPSGDDVDVAA